MNPNLSENFRELLDAPPIAGHKRELQVQEFLELHTELVPTPNLLNHHLHLGLIISQFPLDTALKTDYAYITKSSDQWRVTLVELESPDKPIFTSSESHIEFTQKFNAAVAQVRSWKVFLRENQREVERRLGPLLVPITMRRNPIEFKYQLIIGRSLNKNASQKKIEHFSEQRQELDIDVMTYDGLIRYYETGSPYGKNVVHLRKNHYAFKHLHTSPERLFAYLGPSDFYVNSKELEKLTDEGFDMSSWKEGRLLSVSGRSPLPDRGTLCTGRTLMRSSV